jgi:predicted permease
MNLFIYQLKQAALSLKKKPGFVFSVVTTMGITLGALLCVFTLAYVMLIKPLPYPEAENLYKVIHQRFAVNNEPQYEAYSYPNIINLYKNQTVFSDQALIFYDQDVITSLDHQPNISIGYTTPEWFALLGSKFILGRGFTETEGLDSNSPVAIISYDSWVGEFNKRDDILSQKVSIKGVSFSIVGVLSEQFIEPEIHYPGHKTSLWLPWDYNSADGRRERWGSFHPSFTFVGKLKKGVTQKQAEQKTTTLVNNTWQGNITDNQNLKGQRIHLQLRSFNEVILGSRATTLWLLLAGVISLVLIASGNILNLFISRTIEQQQQLAIRAAVGAKKSDFFKFLLAETSLLMFLANLVALAISSFGFVILKQNLSKVLPRVEELSLGIFPLTFALFTTILLALIFAKAGLRIINYRAINETLQSSGKGTGIQVSKRLRDTLIASQVAIATVLIFFNISLFNNSTNIINAKLGFELDNMSYLSLAVSSLGSPEPEQVAADMSQIKSKLLELPEVDKVSQAETLLWVNHGRGMKLSGTDEWLSVQGISIDDNYFSMINQKFSSGSNFSQADVKDDNLIIIINDALAKRIAPESSAIGKKVNFGDDEMYTVVGVVQSVKMPAKENIPLRIYYINKENTNFVIKLKDNQYLNRKQVANLVQNVSSNFMLFGFDDMLAFKNMRLFKQKVTAISSATLSLLTFFLASVGLYGILSYSTQMRRFEIGTRMAVGAKGKDIIGLIFKGNSRALLTGLAVSIFVLLSLYFGFTDSINEYIRIELVPLFLITLAAISLLSAIACYVPLRQYITKPVIHSLKGSE